MVDASDESLKAFSLLELDEEPIPPQPKRYCENRSSLLMRWTHGDDKGIPGCEMCVGERNIAGGEV